MIIPAILYRFITHVFLLCKCSSSSKCKQAFVFRQSIKSHLQECYECYHAYLNTGETDVCKKINNEIRDTQFGNFWFFDDFRVVNPLSNSAM